MLLIKAVNNTSQHNSIFENYIFFIAQRNRNKMVRNNGQSNLIALFFCIHEPITICNKTWKPVHVNHTSLSRWPQDINQIIQIVIDEVIAFLLATCK
jgi:hypothetical protein